MQKKLYKDSFRGLIEGRFNDGTNEISEYQFQHYMAEIGSVLNKNRTTKFSNKDSFKDEFKINFNTVSLKDSYDKIYSDIRSEIELRVNQKQDTLTQYGLDVKKEIDDIQVYLKQQYNTTVDISLPSLPPAFSELPKSINTPNIDLSAIDSALYQSVKQEETLLDNTVNAVVNGVRTLWSWIDETYYPTIHQQSTGEFYIDVQAFKSSMSGKSEDIKRQIKNTVEEHIRTLKLGPVTLAEDLEKKIINQSESISAEYERMFTNIHKDLSLSREETEQKIHFLSAINDFIQPFIAEWTRIPINN